jgi:heptosyltransferase-2
VIDYYLQLAYYVGCDSEPYQMELATSPDDERQADAIWRDKGLTQVETVVVLNSGGAFGAAKHWPAEYFAELAVRLVEGLPAAALVVCGPAEATTAAAIEHEAGHPRVVSLAGESLGLGLTKACVRRAGLMVTTDSGPRHFASAFGVPVVTLFGPTHVAWSETYTPHAVHLQKDVECGPCQLRVCPYEHHKCMRELTVDTVFRAAVDLLQQNHAPQAAAAIGG